MKEAAGDKLAASFISHQVVPIIVSASHHPGFPLTGR